MLKKIGVLENLLECFERSGTAQVRYDIEQELEHIKKHYDKSVYSYYLIRYETLQKDQTSHNS